jgi:hypothetical protein
VAAAIGIIAVGVVALVWALASSSQSVDRANQNTYVGPASGLMQRLPGGAARIVFAITGVALVALGVAVLVSG